MTDKELLIKFATFIGWTRIEEVPYLPTNPLMGLDPTDGHCKEVPNYLKDLNVVNDCRKVMTCEQLRQFADELWKIRSSGESSLLDIADTLIWATARDRVEAFLRVKEGL
jgi:hypothetical protein